MSHRDTGYGMSLGIFVRTVCNRNVIGDNPVKTISVRKDNAQSFPKRNTEDSILSVYLIGAWEHACQVFSQGLMAGIGNNLITLPILLYYFFRTSTAGREACDRKT